MVMPVHKLPIGIQDFEKLIQEGYVYIDKTRDLYNIIATGNPSFISRPRRFGKSMTISTLDAIFKAKRELFKGLWIDQSDWDWQTYPVIRLDMSSINRESSDILRAALIDRLNEIAELYNVKLSGVSPSDYLRNLIKQLANVAQVVILVDEYDKPIIDNIKDIDKALEVRDVLKDFYSILKAEDAHVKFIFLTGVTKFSKVSVFSGLNNLDDLTMMNETSTLMGYTEGELHRYFKNEIEALAKSTDTDVESCKKQIKEWYNGYRFSDTGEHVYNPFSVLRLLKYREYKAHWFETGTPTFLLDLISKQDYDLEKLDRLEQGASSFESFEIQDIPTVPLLYQTGYYTVKEYDPRLNSYILGHPNYEVSSAFTTSILQYFAKSKSDASEYSIGLSRCLIASEFDEETFFDLMKKVMATIPYDLYIKKEKYYHSLFYLILKQAGLTIHAEYHTQRGRPDIVIETKEKIFVIEVKLNKTAKEAMQQIKARKYYDMFLDRKLPIYLIGINFNGDTKEIDDHLVERL